VAKKVKAERKTWRSMTLFWTCQIEYSGNAFTSLPLVTGQYTPAIRPPTSPHRRTAGECRRGAYCPFHFTLQCWKRQTRLISVDTGT